MAQWLEHVGERTQLLAEPIVEVGLRLLGEPVVSAGFEVESALEMRSCRTT